MFYLSNTLYLMSHAVIDTTQSSYRNYIINSSGYFGDFGGRFVPEPLIPVMDEVSDAFFTLKDDPQFVAELCDLYQQYIGRPSPLVYAKHLSDHLGGARIYIKNE